MAVHAGRANAATTYFGDSSGVTDDGCDTNDTNGSTAGDICQYSTGGAITCVLDQIGSAYGAEAHAFIKGTFFEAWGSDSNGNPFCCRLPVGVAVGAPTAVWVYGTQYDDDIELYES